MVKKGQEANVLNTISTDDIVGELKRRIAKMDEAKITLAALIGQSAATPRTKKTEREQGKRGLLAQTARVACSKPWQDNGRFL